MLRSKPVNSIDLLIHYFQSGVSRAHKRLTEKINTMADMAGLNIYMDVFIPELLSFDGGVMVDPITSSNVILRKMVSVANGSTGLLTRQ